MLSWLITLCARLLSRTWRVQPPGRAPLEALLARGPVVVAMLHGDMLPLVALHRDLPFVGLVSQSSDGDLAAAVATGLGFGVLRGSSSKGGSAALEQARALIAVGRSPAFTVDGPRGPAGVPQFGALALSRATGVPLVWARAVPSRAWRLGSWDRFCVPRPGARITLSYGELAPPDEGSEALEQARQQLQRCLAGLEP